MTALFVIFSGMAPVNKAAAAAAAAINAALAQKGIFLPNSAGAAAPAEEGGPAPGLESASWPPAATSPAQPTVGFHVNAPTDPHTNLLVRPPPQAPPVS